MILNRKLYMKMSFLQSLWSRHQIKGLMGDKIFKTFKLHKTEWPNKFYFYSSRLRKIPRFTGDKEKLSKWKESRLCETLCPTQAIKVTANAFIIDDRGCIACGLCFEMAPSGVLEFSSEPLNIYRS